MSCPNRDGNKGSGGCTFCSEKRSGDFAGSPQESIENQFIKSRQALKNKWEDAEYIAYFQAGTNTYAPIKTLTSLYNSALAIKNVVGLNIATRADCIDEKIADLLYEYSRKTYLEVELGLQSIYDKTALETNRCHTYEEFIKGYNLLKERNINVCIHIIDGLPGEDYVMMMQTAKEVGRLKPHSLKIHLMHILKDAPISESYLNGDFKALSYEEYIKTICDQLEIIPPEIIIQRLTGDGDKENLIAPLWSLDKRRVLNGIDKELVKRNSWQGIKCKE